jgi:hypothetical protein
MEGFERGSADEQADIYGMLDDLDRLEEILEDLDEFQMTTRDDVAATVILIEAGKLTPTREDALERLTDLRDSLDEFGFASREDIVARLATLDNDVEDIETDEDQDLT